MRLPTYPLRKTNNRLAIGFDMAKWISGRLLVEDETAKERFIIRQLVPFVRKLRESEILLRYHFLRYFTSEDGYYLRLRFQVREEDAQEVETLIRTELLDEDALQRWITEPYGTGSEVARFGSEAAVELLWHYLEGSSDTASLLLVLGSRIPSREHMLNELSHLFLNQCGFWYPDEVVFHARRVRDRLTCIPDMLNENTRRSLEALFNSLAASLGGESLMAADLVDRFGKGSGLDLSLARDQQEEPR